uniref:Uncharacterized protein n=1 Tax=viral metagenome TaxID=1070528 RepID=A0A6C0K1G1_9ZZZZ
MASMLGLVSTMAEELNFIRGRLQMMSYVPQTGGVSQQQQETAFSHNSDADNLIPVSDGDDDSDSEDEEDSEDSEDEDESEDSSGFEFIAPLENIIELSSNNNAETIKIINFGELVNSPSENVDEDLEDLDEMQELDDMDDLESGSDEENNTIDQDLDQDLDQDVDSELTEKVITDNLSFIKNIDISNLEEHSESGNVDYKKMSMTKLKSIAVAKGLIQENSKATKNVILKMLSSE